MASLDIPQEAFNAISAEIESDKSVVGIDARKTHILILHLLLKLQEQLDRIENKLDEAEET